MTKFLESLFFWKKPKSSPVKELYTKRQLPLAPAKQAELDALCKQLFKRKELITSGKLQFIGLAKIKKRMGKQWAGLCKIVYDTAEDVIKEFIEKGDVFIRYQDDTYVLIFARASLEEGQLKAQLIAEEIRKRLYSLDEEELRDLEIRKAICEIRTQALIDLDFPDMIDFISNDHVEEPVQEEEPDIEISAVEVETKHARSINMDTDNIGPRIKLHYSYIPLWDTQRGALTTYLCLARGSESEVCSFDSHALLYENKDAAQKDFLDHKMLEIVAHELEQMERDGRKLLVVCPVRHETVYHFDRYEKYKQLLSQIPAQRRQFLILLVMDIDKQEKITKDPYWFATPLKQFCRHVFAELPLRRDINFNYLRNSGVDAAGVRLQKDFGPEQQIITIMNSFSAKAKALKIGQTFVLDVSTLSLTTSVVCAGVNYIGGPAIHEAVARPDSVHRYHHEDLLSSFIKK